MASTMPKAAVRSRLPPRRVPQRTCVGCGSVNAKRQLVRIVCGLDCEVRDYPTGKAAGRGAYFSANRHCGDAALKKKRLEGYLNVAISPASLEALKGYAEELPVEPGA